MMDSRAARTASCIACDALGLRAIQAKKFKVTTDSNHSKPIAPDLLEQNFSATAPNQQWSTDITYVWSDEGWL
jgi:putative transposase